MGYRLNRLDEPVFMAVSKPLLTEFGIHHRLESCDGWFHETRARFKYQTLQKNVMEAVSDSVRTLKVIHCRSNDWKSIIPLHTNSELVYN